MASGTRGQRLRRRPGQSGAVLIVGLVILALITVMVVSSFALSNSNLKSVTNIQRRDEAVAAGSAVVEAMLGSDVYFKAAPGTVIGKHQVDIDKDGVDDFMVMPVVTCIGAIQAATASPSETELGAALSSSASWIIESDVAVTVTDLRGSGASVVIHEGVRTQVSEAEKKIACSI